MPWPNTLGWPAIWANVSSWWMGLKSPEAPAYRTRSVRLRFSTTTGGSSSPSFTSSKKRRALINILRSRLRLHRALGLDEGAPAVGGHLAALVGELGLGDDEQHLPAALALLLEDVLRPPAGGQHVAGSDRPQVLELLLAVQ